MVENHYQSKAKSAFLKIFNIDKALSQNGFLAHLFGVENKRPTGTVTWQHTLQALNMTNLLQGIKITPNFLFLLLFAGLVGWLFIIYWIRHNEPFANSVLGTHYAPAPTAHVDRQLVAGTKEALPFRTSQTTGDIYVPTPQINEHNQDLNQTNPTYAHNNSHIANPDISHHGIYNPNGMSAYLVPITHSAGNTRVKMIVNR
jgi:hypothetical protein